MFQESLGNTWQDDSDNIILLVNRSGNNYILDLPSGRCRLDAGRQIRIFRSVLEMSQVRELVEQGQLTVE